MIEVSICFKQGLPEYHFAGVEYLLVFLSKYSLLQIKNLNVSCYVIMQCMVCEAHIN